MRDDDREIAKVLDFGIARRSSSPLAEGANTKTGSLLGTPYYMSPEQAQGVRTLDYRSDLWSVAVIAFRCITGVLPFRSEALGDLLLRIIVHPLPVLRGNVAFELDRPPAQVSVESPEPDAMAPPSAGAIGERPGRRSRQEALLPPAPEVTQKSAAAVAVPEVTVPVDASADQ